MHAAAALISHCQRFNTAVQTGDFTAMVEHFAEDAEMVFEGVDAGPFSGRAAIAEAYAVRSPHDQVLMLHAEELEDGTLVGEYAWASSAQTRAGGMRMTLDGDLIRRLVVTFD